MARSIVGHISGMVIRELDSRDGPSLQGLCEACADFYELAYQRPPGAAEAQGIYTGLPRGASYRDKLLLGVFDRTGLVAVVDVIKASRTGRSWQIGLVLLKPECRNHGLGTKLYRKVRNIARADGATIIELAVAPANISAIRFWLRQGFVQLDSAGDMVRMQAKITQ